MSQPKKKQAPPMRIQNVFIFLLLAVFAICAIFLTSLTAQVYRDTVQVSEENNAQRVVDAIVRGAARGEDAGTVSIREEGGTETVDEDGTISTDRGITVLTFSNNYEGEVYLRRLFCYDGWLRESFTAEEYGFSPDMGDPLVEITSFEPELNGNLLEASVVTKEGAETKISVHLWAGGTDR